MPEKVNKVDDADELSLLLDEMNAGRKPECENRELAELLAVAEMIRNSNGPICPPQHILDQTVDRALAGLESDNLKPSRSWLLSGALGTAAAVTLVIGLNMLPSWQGVVPVAPPVVVIQQTESPEVKVIADEKPAVLHTMPADTTSASKQPAPAVEQQKTATTVAQVPLPEPPKSPVMVREKAIIIEEAPRTSHAKSAYIPEVAESPTPALIPLKLPGKVPDLVVTDKVNGVLRQVFFKGTPKEVTITQRLKPAEENYSQAKSQNPSVSKAAISSSKDAVNIVQIMISDKEVTVAGRLSQQELLQIAEALTQ